FFPILLITHLSVVRRRLSVATDNGPLTTNISSANCTKQFTAHIRLAGAPVAHDALARAHHGDAHAVKHLGQLLDLLVEAAAGLALALQLVNDLFAAVGILQANADL